MPTVSKKQKRFMQAVAHNKDFAKKVEVPQRVARHYLDADKKYKPQPSKEHKGYYEIPGYSRYCAHPDGLILTKKTGNATRGGDAGAYLRIAAYPDNEDKIRLCYTHDLMCRAFYGPPPEKAVVLHKDNNRKNNKYDNLSWGTQSANMKATYDDGLRTPTYKKVSTESNDQDLINYFKLREYQLEAWLNNEREILWITGYEGSGKSTLTTLLSQWYSVPSINADDLFFEVRSEVPRGEDVDQFQQDLIDAMIKKIHSYPGKKIVESLIAPLYVDYDQDAIIYIDKGLISSTYKAGKKEQKYIAYFTTFYGISNLLLRRELKKLRKYTKAIENERLIPSEEQFPLSQNW